jgi:hypothetical protein
MAETSAPDAEDAIFRISCNIRTYGALSQNEVIPKQHSLNEVAKKPDEESCHLPMAGLTMEMDHKKSATPLPAHNARPSSMNCLWAGSCCASFVAVVIQQAAEQLMADGETTYS